MINTKRKPPWLHKRFEFRKCAEMNLLLRGLDLRTVCQDARCPNIGECYSRGHATFLILGDCCTRNCGFCNLQSGRPQAADPEEPRRVAEAASRLSLRHVVVTSVTRDDLPDGGAQIFARTVSELKSRMPHAVVEVLIPDFQGLRSSLETLVASGPHLIAHNVETVPRLYPEVRPAASYRRSLILLGTVKKMAPRIRTKSGLMLGLGETGEELQAVWKDLRRQGCEFLSMGQYLSPSKRHVPVRQYVSPQRFARERQNAYGLGFRYVASAPYVRSSYLPEEYLTG
ncbi:MAG: lipoyl synthase [Candidatus Omnitrophica bacterium]|nr:lipoyl synthase [Candidatus Omnitrophota bacterium]